VPTVAALWRCGCDGTRPGLGGEIGKHDTDAATHLAGVGASEGGGQRHECGVGLEEEGVTVVGLCAQALPNSLPT
jgi:hypothetical protein